MAKPKKPIPAVPAVPVEARPLFTVEAKQYVALVFPEAFYSAYGKHDFSKNLSVAEAREISAALKAAAAEIE